MEDRILLFTFLGIICLLPIFSLRVVYVLSRLHSSAPSPNKRARSKDEPATLGIFFGSGGHTAEMMRLLDGVNFKRYSTRIYLISSGDSLSERKALELEKSIGSGSFSILHIPRARAVGQSYFTSIFTTLYTLAHCCFHISLLPLFSSPATISSSSASAPLRPAKRNRRVFADAIILNGPGSCVPIAFCAFLPRIFGLPSPSLIYIESLARTKRLSLSGKMVRFIVDRFFVQWDSLRNSLTRRGEGGWRIRAKVECVGWLV